MKRKKVLAVAAGVVVVFAALTSVTVTKQNEYKMCIRDRLKHC